MTVLLDDDYYGVVTITLLWLFLVYVYLFGEAGARNAHKDRPKFMLAASRAYGNTVEQGLPFLLGLWTYAITIDPVDASQVGIAYMISRLLYPLMWAVKGEFTPFVAFSTIPGYTIIMYLWFATIMKSAFDTDVAKIADSVALALIVEGIPAFIVLQIITKFLYVGILHRFYSNEGEQEPLAGNSKEDTPLS